MATKVSRNTTYDGVAYLDLAKGELRNPKVHSLAAAPASPVAGQLYYDTGSSAMFFYNGSAWVNAGGSVVLGANTFTGEQTAPDFKVSGLNSAVNAGCRFVGATASGPPASGGPFAVGDVVVDRSGEIYVCTTAGSPGTWWRAGTAILNSANTWSATNTFTGAVVLNGGAGGVTGNANVALTNTIQGTALIAAGLTGAVATSRYVGATASGAPASGTFALGDFVISQTGDLYVCTTAGTPGTWTRVGNYLLGANNVWTGTQQFNGNMTGSGSLSLTNTIQGTALIAAGLTGATQASRYGGATASGAPTTGTWVTGDWVVDRSGNIFICTAGGSPGTWIAVLRFGNSATTAAAGNDARLSDPRTPATGSITAANQFSGTGFIPFAALAQPQANFDLGGVFGLTGLPSPVNPTDAAHKQYVDNAVAGLSWKDAAQVATTAALPAYTYANGPGTITATGFGSLIIDGYTLVLGDRVIVKNEASAANNGLYSLTTLGDGVTHFVLTRTTDADSPADLLGATAFVENGTVNGGTTWTMTQNAAITIGTTAIPWAQFSGASTATAGSGLTASGNAFNVGAGTGIAVAADTVSVDRTYANNAHVPQLYSTNIGDGATTSFVVNHNLGTRAVVVQVFQNASPWDDWDVDVQRTSTNSVTIGFTTPPTTNQFTVVVHG